MAEKEIDWDDIFTELAKRELKEGNLKVMNTRTEI